MLFPSLLFMIFIIYLLLVILIYEDIRVGCQFFWLICNICYFFETYGFII